jgi:type II secretory pathway pseudopilin PulG
VASDDDDRFVEVGGLDMRVWLRNERAFTIMEVTAAIVIFLFAMVGVTVAFTGQGLNSQVARLQDKARELANRQMEQIKHTDFYIPWGGSPQDIDDSYYNDGYAINNPGHASTISNANQLVNPRSWDYGTITGYESLKMTIGSQYLWIDGSGNFTIPTMKTGFGPRLSGYDKPQDNSATPVDLTLIKVVVDVYYKNQSGTEMKAIELMDMVSSAETKIGPKISSIDPAAGEKSAPGLKLLIMGENFGTAPTVELRDVTVPIASPSTVGTYSTTVNSTGTRITTYVNLPGDFSGPWNVNVTDTATGFSDSLVGGFRAIENPPNIYGLDPISGPVGTAVKITGFDFGRKDTGDKVTFTKSGGGTVDVTSYDSDGNSGNDPEWTNTYIWVRVPATATTGAVTVVTNLGSSGTNPLYPNPTFYLGSGLSIESISNQMPGKSGASGNRKTDYFPAADSGDLIRIIGTGFGSPPVSTDYVYFGAVSVSGANCVSWNNTQIWVRIPDGAPAGAPLLVKVQKASGSSNNMNFWIPYASGH